MNGKMDNREIYVLGIGHNSPVFIDLAEACGYEVKGLYHYNGDRTGEFDHGFEILGSFDDLCEGGSISGRNFLLSMGDNNIRANICDRILSHGGVIPSLIHPSAVISRFAKISNVGVYISPLSYVQADSEVCENTIILSGVNISHNNKIGRNCFIAGGATIGAYTTVEDFVFVGQGALSISGKVNVIGHHSYIGARSLITHDVPAGVVVAGTPAKIVKNIQI